MNLNKIQIDKNVVKKAPGRVQMNFSDPKLNFVCGTTGKDNDLDNTLISSDCINYGITTDKIQTTNVETFELPPEPSLLEPEPALDEVEHNFNGLEESRKNLGYFQVKSIEEGMKWYKDMDNKIPDCLLPLMARWSFGDLSTITKKQAKNQHKKAVKKGKHKTEVNSIKINRTPTLISWD